MADLTPNDLSHLSDEAFWALCPQGEHAPGPEPLSPAARAVLDAATPALNNLDACGFNHQRYDRKALAAALRAAADAVEIDPYTFEHAEFWSALHTIAAELENHQ